ncbi:hypothetical protein F5876DRAFT_72050 [Lentinula aff. lateritia]|uniref:Uncharacterized protein n=1 Tax=Lentinula aff. lateritia TaxID=2804960 RepID=A0ACC1UEE9_9AGAR|nr:hypothetical protein F5876DRAFT_72050 [Lentinula aff. lateritia]
MREYRLLFVSAGERYTSSMLVLFLTTMGTPTIQALGPWLQAPQRVVHSVLCTRVLFLIFQRKFPSTRATMVSEEHELPVATLTEILELEDM